MRTRRWSELSRAQVHAARRFSEEVPGLTISQAAKRLDECFACLDLAKERALRFREVWENDELFREAVARAS